MTVERIKKAAVIWPLAMGHGITALFAMNGYEVAMVDIDEAILRKAKDCKRRKAENSETLENL